MLKSALDFANDLLPHLAVDCASFGTIRRSGNGETSPVARVPLRPVRGPRLRAGDPRPTIMAAGPDCIFFIDPWSTRPSADMLAVSDVRAELARAGWHTSVSIRPNVLLSRFFGYDFEWEFLVKGGRVTADRRAASLVQAGNREGAWARSHVPLLRFLARSIVSQRNGVLPYADDIISRGYRAFVSQTSVAGVIETLAREEGWLQTFASGCAFEQPDPDEVFLLFHAGRWILTNRRLYLTDEQYPPSAFRLEDIRTCRIHKLRRNLEIRLASGETVTRPASADDYLSELEFNRARSVVCRHRSGEAQV